MVMGNNYNQLNIEDRVMIGILKAEGNTVREIGRKLGRSHSTILRELKRNACPVHDQDYLAHRADAIAEKRKREAGRRERLKSRRIRNYVRRKLKLGWSPGQIAGRLKNFRPDMYVCHEAIYQYVHAEALELRGYLAQRHKKRKKKGQSRKHRSSHIPNRISIDERPDHINNREEFGHWEADSLVSSKNRKAGLIVLAERQTRFAKLKRVNGRTAENARKAINQKLCRYPEDSRQSITYDNGSENVEHELVNEALGTKSYFCNPYRSWEKGLVENTCGLIRRFIPKKTNIALITDVQVRRIERLLNNRPRKCLDYHTPAEVFAKLCGALAG